MMFSKDSERSSVGRVLISFIFYSSNIKLGDIYFYQTYFYTHDGISRLTEVSPCFFALFIISSVFQWFSDSADFLKRLNCFSHLKFHPRDVQLKHSKPSANCRSSSFIFHLFSSRQKKIFIKNGNEDVATDVRFSSN